MNKYYIDYISKDDDYCHIWVMANSKEEAEQNARQEYWDIKEIVNISKR